MALAAFEDVVELGVGEVLDADELVLGLRGADQLVELGLKGGVVAVLGVLDQEHHQEGDDRRAGVDHQLPGVGVVEERARDGPDEHDKAAEQEGRRASGPA